MPQLEVSLLAPQHSKNERRAFHYFTYRAGALHGGTVDATFWEVLIPRLSQTYDFVWDVMVCLGCLHEHVPYASLTTVFDAAALPGAINQGHQQALRLYNRAIANVRQLTEHDQMDDALIALSYMLFAAVEFQQRNVKTGNDLVGRCGQILSRNLMSLGTRQNSALGHAIHEVVTPFVLKKGVVGTTLKNALPPGWVASSKSSKIPKEELSRFRTLTEAASRLHSLMNQSYDMVRLADFAPNVRDDDPDKIAFLVQRQSLLDELMQWKVTFTATDNLTTDEECDWMSSYLVIYWAVCYISLAACVSLHQTIFDDHMERFAEIVEHASIFLRHSAHSTNVGLSSNDDPGVVPALYFCATKCRDPVLRREASSLMRQAPRSENLWAFVASDRVVAKVISIEEGERQSPSPKGSPVMQCAGLPPEERRFAYISVMARQGAVGKQRLALELSRFEFAADGSRRLTTDYAWLDDEEEVWSDAQRERPDSVA